MEETQIDNDPDKSLQKNEVAGAGAENDSFSASESWETANVEEQMSNLLLKAKSNISLEVSDKDVAQKSVSASASDSQCSETGGPSQAVPSSSASDTFGTVDTFLREALQKPQDRLTILRLEQEVEKFIRDPSQQVLEFPYMSSSYRRLACHRVAQHYLLQTSVVDGYGKEGSRIVARKVKESQMPGIRLADIPLQSSENDSAKASHSMVKLAIKQRPQKLRGLVDGAGDGEAASLQNPAMSVEERKVAYDRARARIFNGEDGSQLARAGSTAGQGGEEGGGAAESGEARETDSAADPAAAGGSGGGALFSRRSSPVKGEGRGSGRGNGRGKALLRDKERERRDPDFDRNLDRYQPRFDASLGPSTSPYPGQALYAPMTNYNTEFPPLGGPQRANSGSLQAAVVMDHIPTHVGSIHPHARGQWMDHMGLMQAQYPPGGDSYHSFDAFGGQGAMGLHQPMPLPVFVPQGPQRGMMYSGPVMPPAAVYSSSHYDQYQPQYAQAGQPAMQPRRQ